MSSRKHHRMRESIGAASSHTISCCPIKSHTVHLHNFWTCPIICSSLCGQRQSTEASSFGSHPFGDVPTHGEPSLEAFFMAALPTAPPAIAVSLHGLLEREHWPRSHPPASHATCQRGMAQEGEASGDRHLPHRDNRCLLGLLGC